MRPKQRIRKIYTQSDISEKLNEPDENIIKTNNINIKDLELNVNETDKNTSQAKNNRNFIYKNTPFNLPNKFNKINRKQLIKKLPDINFTSLSTISRPLKLNPINPIEQKNDERFSNNKKNTFLLNSLFQILKPQDNADFVENKQANKLKDRSLKFNQKTNISIDSFYENEFINLNNSSTKNRGPKIIENQITRLSNPNNIMRRKIVSQEKSRPKYRNKSIQKLKETTFQNFKRCVRLDEESEQLELKRENHPRQNFENLEIITFYNKFPNFNKEKDSIKAKDNKKRYDEKQSKSQTLIENKEMRQYMKPNLKPLKKGIKTQMPLYQEENEFIFEKR